jgi:chromosome segregation ATPase
MLYAAVLCHVQVQRKLEAAESRASTAGKRLSELTTQLGGAEDQIVALEGHISVLEEELSKYNQLPQ